MSDELEQPAHVVPERSFGCVVCGVDGSSESLEAARQASALARPDALVRLVAAVDPLGELWDSPPYQTLATAERVRTQAEATLEQARREIGAAPPVELEVVEGRATDALLARVAPERDCLLAVGARKQDRLTGILLGATVTEVLHDAPCSVLVARERGDRGAFPHSILVGLDGSPESAAAFAVARTLAERLGAPLRPVVALGGQGADLASVQRILDGLHFMPDERAPVDALTAAAGELLVVGSRGLHGLAALGSVSERVAHRAEGSVLVVRPA